MESNRIIKPKEGREFWNSGGRHYCRVGKGSPKTKACQLWENIKVRLRHNSETEPVRYARYRGVDIDPDWLDFQRFADWFETKHYYEGWQLDKDLLGGNEYSPENCVFLPEELNKALNIKPNKRGKYPLGVTAAGWGGVGYTVRFKCKYPEYEFRVYTNATGLPEALEGYIKARNRYIRHLTDKYKDQLEDKAYQALLKYDCRGDVYSDNTNTCNS